MDQTRRRVVGIAALAVCIAAFPRNLLGTPAANLPPQLAKAASDSAFSFTYGGKPAQSLLQGWKRVQRRSNLADGRVKEEVTFTDTATGLEITRETVLFRDHTAIETMLRLHNGGSSDSPLIENIRPVDFALDTPRTGSIVFHHALGSAPRSGTDGWDMSRDFEPVEKKLTVGEKSELVHYVMSGGKHVESYLPFFNLAWQSGGLIGGIGWTGQWWMRVSRDSDRTLALQAGQEKTRLRLHPGEGIRTPRVLLAEWQGSDRITGQNLLRRILIEHYLPRINGEVQLPPIAHSGAYALIFDDIAEKTGKNPLTILPTLEDRDLGTRFADPGAALNWVTPERSLRLINDMPPVGIETYWWDAGWFEGQWPDGRGTWIPRKQFSMSLRQVGEAAHAKGMKFLLWYDPEGVAAASLIAKEHPGWVLHQPDEGTWGGIYKWSDPAAREYMTALIAGQIRDWGIDIYRNDRNTCPLPFWQAADDEDRQGMTEILQIEGFYAFLDSLLERFPKLTIDNANWRVTGPDLEMMKRSIGSLTRTELAGPGLPHPVPEQAQTAQLSLWIPLHASLLHSMDTYSLRSTATTGVAIGLDLQSPYIPVGLMKKGIAEIKAIRPFWLGDYYPLTAINRDERSWCAWQFDRPDLGEGFAMFFRRSQAEETLSTGLRGISPRANYQVSFAETYDVKEERTMAGAALIRVSVKISSAPGSMLVRYRRLTER
jgi:alpha-galactosidase